MRALISRAKGNNGSLVHNVLLQHTCTCSHTNVLVGVVRSHLDWYVTILTTYSTKHSHLPVQIPFCPADNQPWHKLPQCAVVRPKHPTRSSLSEMSSCSQVIQTSVVGWRRRRPGSAETRRPRLVAFRREGISHDDRGDDRDDDWGFLSAGRGRCGGG